MSCGGWRTQILTWALGLVWVVIATTPLAAQASQVGSFSAWIDHSETATLETATQNTEWESFIGWKGWGYGPEPVWIKIRIPAEQQVGTGDLVLIVRPPFLDKVQFFDPGMRQQKIAGDFFSARDDAIGTVLFTFIVRPSAAPRNVYLHIQTTSARVVHLTIMPFNEAKPYTRLVEWGTGFILVVSFIFFAWSLTHWLLSRDKLMRVFAVKQAIVTLWGFLFFGFGRLTLGDLFSEGTLSQISSLAVAGLLWSGLWFYSALLQHYKANSIALRCMHLSAILIAVLSLGSFFGLTRYVLQITNALTPLFFGIILAALWRAPKVHDRSLISKNLLLTYLTGYALLHSLPTMTYVGLIAESSILTLGMGFLTVDGFVMLVILGMRQHTLKEQHKAVASRLMLQEEQARLNQQYLEEQRQLLAMLAHEIKTPLANLRLWMDAGAKGQPVMERAIQDINRVIERCVHTGQLADHRLKPHLEWLDAAEITLAALSASKQPQRGQLDLPAEPCPVHADPQMLSIALGNLLDNAYKYSPPGTPIFVTLRKRAESTGKPLWQWSVENHLGQAGFPEPNKVFHKYYRSAGARRQSGSGLGLFLVKSLAELMQGRVSYTPLRHGVRFELILPVQPHQAVSEA